MNLKLTYDQLTSLHRLFIDEIISEKPTEPEDKLIMLHMISIYKKLRNKIEARFHGRGFGITITEAEALAYHAYFKTWKPLKGYQYESIMILSQVALIDKTYG